VKISKQKLKISIPWAQRKEIMGPRSDGSQRKEESEMKYGRGEEKMRTAKIPGDLTCQTQSKRENAIATLGMGRKKHTRIRLISMSFLDNNYLTYSEKLVKTGPQIDGAERAHQ